MMKNQGEISLKKQIRFVIDVENLPADLPHSDFERVVKIVGEILGDEIAKELEAIVPLGSLNGMISIRTYVEDKPEHPKTLIQIFADQGLLDTGDTEVLK